VPDPNAPARLDEPTAALKWSGDIPVDIFPDLLNRFAVEEGGILSFGRRLYGRTAF